MFFVVFFVRVGGCGTVDEIFISCVWSSDRERVARAAVLTAFVCSFISPVFFSLRPVLYIYIFFFSYFFGFSFYRRPLVKTDVFLERNENKTNKQNLYERGLGYLEEELGKSKIPFDRKLGKTR